MRPCICAVLNLDAVARAIDDGLEFQAFGAEYVANALEMRQRRLPELAALRLTHRADLLQLDLAPADLSLYDRGASP